MANGRCGRSPAETTLRRAVRAPRSRSRLRLRPPGRAVRGGAARTHGRMVSAIALIVARTTGRVMTELMPQTRPTMAAMWWQPGGCRAKASGRIDATRRACTYLAAGMITSGEPLLRKPLSPSTSSSGSWGTGARAPAELRLRSSQSSDQQVRPRRRLPRRPGHGAPGVLAAGVLEGTYSEVYPNKGEDEEGCASLQRISFPGGIGSHCTPETPGSIHEARAALQHFPRVRRRLRQSRSAVAVVVGDAKLRRDRWPPPGIQQVPEPDRDARCCRFCISTATRSTTPHCFREFRGRSWRICSRATVDALFRGGRRSRVHAPEDGRHPGGLRAGDPADPAGGARERHGQPRPLADDRAALAKGWTGPKSATVTRWRASGGPPGAAAGMHEDPAT